LRRGGLRKKKTQRRRTRFQKAKKKKTWEIPFASRNGKVKEGERLSGKREKANTLRVKGTKEKTGTLSIVDKDIRGHIKTLHLGNEKGKFGLI